MDGIKYEIKVISNFFKFFFFMNNKKSFRNQIKELRLSILQISVISFPFLTILLISLK